MTIKSKAYGNTSLGIVSIDDEVYTVKENEIVTIKAVNLFVLAGDVADIVEMWWGLSYAGSNAICIGKPSAVNGTVNITMHPNVKVLPGERITVSIAQIAAGSSCTYSVVYDVETQENSTVLSANNNCGFIDNLLGRC